jgi:hypothetical protein
MKCFYCGKIGNTSKGFEAVSEYRVGFSLHTSACEKHKELRRVFEMRILEIYEKYYQKDEEASRGSQKEELKK